GDSRVRVTPQLIRVADDTHLWSERYDRVLEDIFAVQTEIATHVIEQLNVTLLEPERAAIETHPTDNMLAYQAYLRGRDYAGRVGYSARLWRLAIEMFERAVELDPDFALAYTELANAHSGIFNMGAERTTEHIEKCKAAVDRALELQPDLPEARLALGYYYYHCHRDYDRALEEFERAGASLPNQEEILLHIGWIRRRQSRWDEALAHINKSLELNPRDPHILFEIAITHSYLRNYKEAVEFFDRSIVLSPDQVSSYGMKALTLWLAKADLPPARAVLQQVAGERQPMIDILLYWQYVMEGEYDAGLELLASGVMIYHMPDQSTAKPAAEGYLYDLMGDTVRARELYESARELMERELTARPGDSRVYSALGSLYARLGRNEDAIRAAKKAVELTPVSADALRGPRFVDVLAWTYVLTGDHDPAIDLIDHLLSIPALASVPLFRIDPRWDPIRDNPKFQAVLKKHSKVSS
ncbi:MAG: tetratricopeptide repeat protein, partial [Candidatus Latescibacterota bacterium]